MKKKSLAEELAAFEAIEVDALVVENVPVDSLAGGFGLAEFGASCSCGDPGTFSSCHHPPAEDDEYLG